ncbi:urease accessory protein UreD [Methyloradius palustris]|uniref:Urease accessory protein UreD n=1 Tax=Methyloradius palustris TaxID=2778876 RepID=A0A8D5JXD5_9PROT|nr:urease accessory protein UreD [Methyloradius palustris]BCM26024.1 urease accessory protein UreD 2 [Methyloradius palustris]
MDDAYLQQSELSARQAAVASLNWRAKLSLDFVEKNGRTVLARKQHEGPLVIQKVLYPEGEVVSHAIIVHPPGGVAGGDALTLNVQQSNHSHVLLTTPGAGKWYKSNGRQASQQLNFDLQDSAILEWLPQENILFEGSDTALSAEINLGGQAVFAGWDILCFGRQASNEEWLQGKLNQRLAIRRNNQLIWNERTNLSPQSRAFASMAGLRGQVVSASFVVAAGAVPAEIIAACREVSAGQSSKIGLTALPQIFSARYIGHSAQSARQYFEALWHILRPWYATRQSSRPRIWST